MTLRNFWKVTLYVSKLRVYSCWCKYIFTIYTYLSLLRLMHYLFICIFLFVRHLGVCVLSLSYTTHIGVCIIHWVVMLTTQISTLLIWHMLSTTQICVLHLCRLISTSSHLIPCLMEDNPYLVDMCLVVWLIMLLTSMHSRCISEAFIYRHS